MIQRGLSVRDAERQLENARKTCKAAFESYQRSGTPSDALSGGYDYDVMYAEQELKEATARESPLNPVQ